MAHCHTCELIYKKSYRKTHKANPELAKIHYDKYAESHPDEIKASSRKYYGNHKEEHKQSVQSWVNRNKDKYTADKKKWASDNKDKGRKYHYTRRDKSTDTVSTFTEADWGIAIAYFEGRCAYCGMPPSLFDRNYVLEQDHFIPVTNGGAYTPDNIVPACQSCNRGKWAKDPIEWITYRFGKRKSKQIIKQILEYFNTVVRD